MKQESNEKPHFWIPEEEVIRVSNSITGRDKPRNVSYDRHGAKLSAGLKEILEYHKKTEKHNSLQDEGIIVFKVTLPEGEKISNSKRQENLENNGIVINAVKSRTKAIVSVEKQKFTRFGKKVNQYQSTGKNQYFQYFESFEPFEADEKQASGLRRTILESIEPPEKVDVQIQILPRIDSKIYEKILPKIQNKIQKLNGQVIDPYYLSDGTPVIRAIIPSSALDEISEDESIYRLEETTFFSPITESDSDFFTENIELDASISIENLPIITILDSGIDFPNNLSPLVVDKWIPPSSPGGNALHGTQVAGKTIFKHLNHQLTRGQLTPRVRVIDCNILEGSIPENEFIKRVQLAASKYSELSSIFNLSANGSNPIEGDEISLLAYELDILMQNYNIQFVISSGNHNLWRNALSLEDIIDDDDARIAPPADSMHGITVGSIVGFDHTGSLSQKNDIAPYSRIGPGLAGLRKPDLVAYGATISSSNNGFVIPRDDYSILIAPSGRVRHDIGTSFTAPVVSGDLAEILSVLPIKDPLLAKTLLYHGVQPLFDEYDITDDNGYEYVANIFGRGISNPDVSKYSNSNRVTFLRTGNLNRLTKERVKFHMPSILAASPGRNSARVIVTCLSKPPVDRTRGIEYLGAYVQASLHKSAENNKLPCVNPSIKEGRKEWDSCCHFERTFSSFESGEWQVWLELYTRWNIPDTLDIAYALAITIEDLSGKLDIYSSIKTETQGRFVPLNTLRIQTSDRI